MILSSYRDHQMDPPGKFRYIGYWTSLWHTQSGYGELPDPRAYVAAMDSALQSLLVSYLDVGKNPLATVKAQWRGWSNCRICDCDTGSRCLTDGVFVWPEGFGHYVGEHSVRPPAEFIDHVRQTLIARARWTY
jgi:hypothetical protein